MLKLAAAVGAFLEYLHSRKLNRPLTCLVAALGEESNVSENRRLQEMTDWQSVERDAEGKCSDGSCAFYQQCYWT